jgi:hypothetical protein
MNLRRNLLATLLVVMAGTTIPQQSLAQTQPQITLAQMEVMFRNMRAKTKWNVDGDLSWGYFFMDPQPAKLRRLADHLSQMGYRSVNLYPSPNGQTHVIHARKVETHTPQSLHQRNMEFYRLADKFGIAAYDGMDVGPAAPQRKP